MLLKCEDCMVTFESESLKDCPSCGTADFIYQLSDNQVLTYEKIKLEKKLSTAVKALENINIAAKSLDDEAEYNYASEALAEIGGEDGKRSI